jgi:hypothetical protein
VFAKLLFIIVAVCAIACALLVVRQQRIDAFHDMTQVHGRLLEHERTLWQMRADIAERCRPSQVRLTMNELTIDWSPLPARPAADSGFPFGRLASDHAEPAVPRQLNRPLGTQERPDL